MAFLSFSGAFLEQPAEKSCRLCASERASSIRRLNQVNDKI